MPTTHRVRCNQPDKIHFLLDAGALGIVCPLINTPQARGMRPMYISIHPSIVTHHLATSPPHPSTRPQTMPNPDPHPTPKIGGAGVRGRLQVPAPGQALLRSRPLRLRLEVCGLTCWMGLWVWAWMGCVGGYGCVVEVGRVSICDLKEQGRTHQPTAGFGMHIYICIPPPLTPKNTPTHSNYLGEANAHIATLAMIETAEAMQNLDEIVKVDGLDGVFIGVCWRKGARHGLCVMHVLPVDGPPPPSYPHTRSPTNTLSSSLHTQAPTTWPSR